MIHLRGYQGCADVSEGCVGYTCADTRDARISASDALDTLARISGMRGYQRGMGFDTLARISGCADISEGWVLIHLRGYQDARIPASGGGF